MSPPGIPPNYHSIWSFCFLSVVAIQIPAKTAMRPMTRLSVIGSPTNCVARRPAAIGFTCPVSSKSPGAARPSRTNQEKQTNHRLDRRANRGVRSLRANKSRRSRGTIQSENSLDVTKNGSAWTLQSRRPVSNHHSSLNRGQVSPQSPLFAAHVFLKCPQRGIRVGIRCTQRLVNEIGFDRDRSAYRFSRPNDDDTSNAGRFADCGRIRHSNGANRVASKCTVADPVLSADNEPLPHCVEHHKQRSAAAAISRCGAVDHNHALKRTSDACDQDQWRLRCQKLAAGLTATGSDAR